MIVEINQYFSVVAFGRDYSTRTLDYRRIERKREWRTTNRHAVHQSVSCDRNPTRDKHEARVSENGREEGYVKYERDDEYACVFCPQQIGEICGHGCVM